LDPGHINGAILYDPATQPFKSANDLKTLPTNKTTVFYCFTGQTSSYFAAYLRMLGYDVRSLLYGANSMIYDLMVSKNVPNTFIPSAEIKKYPFITGTP
jgi:rhodanese-related sulfurtransferase